ncbi:phosphatidate cytidylyltransferase family protein isoform X2 [Wolffia australiana]
MSEVENIQLQYWTSSVSCFGALIFLLLSLRRGSTLSNHYNWRSNIGEKLGLLCVMAYVLICCMTLSPKSSSGLLTGSKLFWLFCHGLACSMLVWHVLQTFPSCASIGEALLVSSGLVVYFGDMLAHTLSKTVPVSNMFHIVWGKQTQISTFMQGILLGLLLLPLLYKNILKIWDKFSPLIRPNTSVADENINGGIWRSIAFHVSLAVLLTLVAPVWMEAVQEFHLHPLLWIFDFVLEEPLARLALCSYWILIIGASVVRFYNISKHCKIERILLRKYYHLVAVLMFLPALLFQPKFLDLAFGAALAVFLALEIIRVWRIWPLGHFVHEFMNAFTDHRDSDSLIVSHFSLLLGCALPRWLSLEVNDRPLTPFAGILSLGIGDTMASVVGHKYGVLRWSKRGKKTVEGTAAGITSVLLASSALLPLLASSGYVLSQDWWSLISAVTVSGLLEAYTAQLDNAFIPLVFYSLLCL